MHYESLTCLPCKIEEDGKCQRYLATIDVIEHEIEFLLRLKRGVQRHQERMELIISQHVSLGHDVLSFVAPHYSTLFQHLYSIQVLISVAACQQHFAETASTQNAKKFKVVRFQSAIQIEINSFYMLRFKFKFKLGANFTRHLKTGSNLEYLQHHFTKNFEVCFEIRAKN